MTPVIKENYCRSGLSFLKVAEKSKVSDFLNSCFLGSLFLSVIALTPLLELIYAEQKKVYRKPNNVYRSLLVLRL
jgi:hypothetical protein